MGPKRDKKKGQGISEMQRKINELLGITDEEFLALNWDDSEDDKDYDSPEELQAAINELMGIDQETWDKYGPDSNERWDLDEVQLAINKMLGIDRETWEKYGPKEN